MTLALADPPVAADRAGPQRTAALTRDAIAARDGAAFRTAISRYISPGEPYALLDFPNHSNVGDSAIWLGEMAALRQVARRDPRYVATTHDFDADRFEAVHPDGPIFLHGGGNFGDLYGRHQAFREAIAARYPDRTIVQLPQTIKYREAANATDTARGFGAHRHLALMVRDERSLEFAHRHFACAAMMVPDAAMALGPLIRRGAPRQPVLMLLRDDVEQVVRDFSAAPLLSTAQRADWVGEPAGAHRTARQRAALRSVLMCHWSPEARRLVLYDALATARLERGLTLLSRAASVVTDRLHAHLLSLLMGIPHVVMDNDYGKNHGYIAAWTGSFERMRQAASAAQAEAMLRDLAHAGRP